MANQDRHLSRQNSPAGYSRRASLKLGLQVGFGLFAGTTMMPQRSHAKSQPSAEAESDSPGAKAALEATALKYRASVKGLLYGAASDQPSLAADADLRQHLVKECSLIALDGPLKWTHASHILRPSPSVYDFSAADWCMDFAQKHHLAVQAHNLVFYLDFPEWLKETATPENIESILRDHARTVMGRYSGQIHSWNTVNEAIEPSDGRSDGLRRTQWLELMGDDYIERTFRIAAAADPKTILILNEHTLELNNAGHEARRTAMLKLLERLKSRDVPVHALGLQAHLDGQLAAEFSPDIYRKFLADVASLGLKILVTELDITDKNLPADIAARDRIVASYYRDYLSTVLDERAVIAVTTFGLTDRHTWLKEYQPRSDGLPIRPLLLDENYKRKPAWYAVAEAIDRASSR